MSTPIEQFDEDGPKLGLFPGISEEDYHHRLPGIGHSGLVTLGDSSPGHFMYEKLHPRKRTEAMDVGSAFHCALLRPDDYANEFVMDTGENRNSKVWKSWAAEQREQALTIIRQADWHNIDAMVNEVRIHSRASILCNPDDIEAEMSGYWIDPQTRKLCKCRIDAWNDPHELIVDVKKGRDASYTGFAKAIADYGYYVQDAHYMEGMFRIGRPAQEFVFVVVEDKPPYGIGIYYLDETTKQHASTHWRRLLNRYAECHNANEWPLYDKTIRSIGMAPWGYRAKVS